jgi:DNA-binding LacI/PurR family transcriptional regulator
MKRRENWLTHELADVLAELHLPPLGRRPHLQAPQPLRPRHRGTGARAVINQGNRNARAIVAYDTKAIRAMQTARRRGLTFEQIAEKWGVSITTARGWTMIR